MIVLWLSRPLFTHNRWSISWGFGSPRFRAVVAFWDAMVCTKRASTVLALEGKRNIALTEFTFCRFFNFLNFSKDFNVWAV